ncbi:MULTISPECIES: hypothetical protein [Thermoprotei]|uniref:hypothetical protein n=1 Tax=Thermoprotei TaxID=183924 RepID=UPI0031620857
MEITRLTYFEKKGFCRYYMGLKGPEKSCEWVYMSLEMAKLLRTIAPSLHYL